MRRVAGLGCWLALLLAVSAPAQKADGGFAVPQSGTLTIWVVTHNPNPRPRARIAGTTAPTVPGYQEKTMAEFGQTAGSVGQTAGSVGQTAGSFGETAGSTGQTAGSAGQTAGSFGTTASSVGKNAGDAGQTVGSFGVSTTDLPEVSARANAIRIGVVRKDPRWDGFLQEIREHFPQLQVLAEYVLDDELPYRLEAVVNTPAAPDVLLANPLPAGWSRADSSLLGPYGVVSRFSAVYHPQTEGDVRDRLPGFSPQAAILSAGGRGPVAARALYLWLENYRIAGDVIYQPSSADAAAAVAIAGRMFRDAKGGGSAETLRIDATAGHVWDRFAVIAMRAVESEARQFGVGYGLAVLRKDDTGRWLPVQLSPNLTLPMQAKAFDILLNATKGKEESNPLGNESPRPLGISQAAPRDGDSRSQQPELWWDNLGGVSLQVVEWSSGGDGTNLFFVPDNNSRLRTRVIARFASAGGSYRWRVWSVGADGTIVFSPWRTMNVVAR